ncbi:2Fe-2S iron-sulfur cluster-binding protein [Streptacidiphilus fuscans]|uniref:(2Fe-2S)-binding protein n=1 Tax=Streptacidiphilus fuscans TaxID=2789292 RepID=A0A931BAW4_9ACTN|nr:2Fe-2S iron-sulfur cluster-binding protein [Streptacidiphilus fuscans]MBF9072802.1 (2Fe-2S)-binding protein [Streptacidiphilus fuscans]
MTLKKLTVLPSGTEILLPAGSPLTEVEYESPDRLIPFGCRSGSCGACVIEVVQGFGCLGEPDLDELDFLEDLGRTGGSHRLACQCRLQGDATICVADDI